MKMDKDVLIQAIAWMEHNKHSHATVQATNVTGKTFVMDVNIKHMEISKADFVC